MTKFHFSGLYSASNQITIINNLNLCIMNDNLDNNVVKKTTDFFNSLLGLTLTTSELNERAKKANVRQGLIYRLVDDLNVHGITKKIRGNNTLWEFWPKTKTQNTRLDGKQAGSLFVGFNGFEPITIRQAIELQNKYNKSKANKKTKTKQKPTPEKNEVILLKTSTEQFVEKTLRKELKEFEKTTKKENVCRIEEIELEIKAYQEKIEKLRGELIVQVLSLKSK